MYFDNVSDDDYVNIDKDDYGNDDYNDDYNTNLSIPSCCGVILTGCFI